MNIDNQDNQDNKDNKDNTMNLNSDNYNSILCDQGALFNKQRNELSKSSKFNKDNAPKPVDSEVKILTIEGGYYAVIEYSGRSSDKNFLKNKDILEKALKQDNLLVLSPPIRASYNSPFTLPILKRNEVMYKVDL